ncbi:MAG: chemotaxis response regulator protein-glutamate methylesterase [Anaerolineales bacterium]|nr:chemotaxis response regulator protein-glutamate methylesterase [Anaerolineales bacterium]
MKTPQENQTPIRILIVDDSAYMRFTIAKRLGETPGFHVVGSARDGVEALELIPKFNPDVVTLDVEMPRLDGLSTLRKIMSTNPRPTIMVSSLTVEGARETVQALTWGAVDFVAKPSSKANIEAIMDDLVNKIRRAANAKVYPISVQKQAEKPVEHSAPRPTRRLSKTDKVVIIGASTGGPRALSTVVPQIPGNLPATYLIVQHMPVGFTRSLAERLNNISNIEIREATPGDTLEVGRGLLAPGGFHMVLDENNCIALNQNPTVHGVRPAIDVTMISAAQKFGSSTVGIILTGMGTDGTSGSALIHSSGGYVIAEDESTCVVWGMPRSVQEAGVANAIAPLNDVAAALQKVF